MYKLDRGRARAHTPVFLDLIGDELKWVLC